ncbi:MAG: methylaspartate mutase subunit E [Desulfobacterales bacterium]|nr:methylaspartate mutase subunit E [Desulfobacterales bacterium]MBF0396788.1 methylaspartate mutase subunit E [Desulfobacterales bacterium]
MKGYTILLGSVGGDSHSVGLNILRQALTENGYIVHYLGTHNQLEDFFRSAHTCNVVMISNMDGHAWYYLSKFIDLRLKYHIPINNPLWYLGGNISLGNSVGEEMRYREMGFNQVFTKYVDISTVLSVLEKDLYGVEPIKKRFDKSCFSHHTTHSLSIPPDFLVPFDELHKTRSEVLQQWHTGNDALSLEANAEFLSHQPSFPKIQALVNLGKLPVLVQPRSGVARVDDQIDLFKAFKSVGVKTLSYQVDSFTRNNNYNGAEEAIRESLCPGSSTLNGFPVINHGVKSLRRIIKEVNAPLQVRHSTKDPRLLAEISYAGGVTAFEGGAICYNIPYYKDYPLNESISRWQYVDRLTGFYYEKFGIVIDREFFGTLTAVLIPPCIAISTGILEALLAAQQGVKCITLGYAEQGHRIQDIAAIRTMESITREILNNFGYNDVQLNTVFHQYMAAFPPEPHLAKELIYNSAITAGLSYATRILTKTAVESYKIPSMADNIEGLSLVFSGIAKSRNGYKKPDEVKITQESAIIRREVFDILDSILYVGNGKIVDGIINGFQKGYIDIPFSPSIYNMGKVITARDIEGAVRFVSTGCLNFNSYLKDFHKDKIEERRRLDRIPIEKQSYMLVEKDVLQIPRGEYNKWPLFP